MADKEKAVIIFTRVPLPGKTKTRMMPYLTAVQCAKLHSCFLVDIRKECEWTDAEIFVYYTPEDEEDLDVLKQILGEEKIYEPQRGENLGIRMYEAIKEVLKKGYKSCILIGTDIPEIRAEYLERGFAVLDHKKVVFGKTEDGGYYLVGMKHAYPEVFGLKTYGHKKVLEETIKELEKDQISVGYTQTLSDMDELEDLRGYRKRMTQDKKLQKSDTGRYLAGNVRISIIIPTYNEEKNIKKIQRQLEGLKKQCEIIFVDGESTDQTRKLIDQGYRVIACRKGRAVQMNEGAKNSTGDILFFLHCDSELPPHPLEEIRRVMKDHRAGCFGIAFHSRNFFMFTCRVISNHRIKDRKVMFGDQGIFVDRELFFEVGMYPELPIMEDYQFSLTLKEKKIKLGMAKRRIYTSDRRFPKGTIPKLRLMWKMNRFRKMYRDGVDIEKIASMYQDVR